MDIRSRQQCLTIKVINDDEAPVIVRRRILLAMSSAVAHR